MILWRNLHKKAELVITVIGDNGNSFAITVIVFPTVSVGQSIKTIERKHSSMIASKLPAETTMKYSILSPSGNNF